MSTQNYVNFQIEKIITHEVFQKQDDGSIPTAALNSEFTVLSAEAIDILKKRIISCMGKKGKCLEMEVEDESSGSVFQRSCEMLYSNDTEFIEHSKELANKLSRSQTSRSIPGGIILVFLGSIGNTSKKLLGILKADIHEGFTRESPGSNFTVGFLDSLFLTPGQKLYKVGTIIEDAMSDDEEPRDSDNFTVSIFDNNIQDNESNNAATYFYSTFLGFKFASTDKKKTKDFYCYTKSFVSNLEISDEKKIDYNSALIVYLKSNSEQVNINDFATQYLDEEFIDLYKNHLIDRGLIVNTFHKDIDMIKSRLKKRILKFNSEIRIIAPSENFDDNINIIEENDDSTTIKIKGKIINE